MKRNDFLHIFSRLNIFNRLYPHLSAETMDNRFFRAITHLHKHVAEKFFTFFFLGGLLHNQCFLQLLFRDHFLRQQHLAQHVLLSVGPRRRHFKSATRPIHV